MQFQAKQDANYLPGDHLDTGPVNLKVKNKINSIIIKQVKNEPGALILIIILYSFPCLYIPSLAKKMYLFIYLYYSGIWVTLEQQIVKGTEPEGTEPDETEPEGTEPEDTEPEVVNSSLAPATAADTDAIHNNIKSLYAHSCCYGLFKLPAQYIFSYENLLL